MNKNFTYIILTVCIIELIAVVFYIQKNSVNMKKISDYRSQVETLEEEVNNSKNEIAILEDKVSKLEDDLAKVKHFDNKGNIGTGFSSGSSSISFTGDVLKTKIDGEFEGWEGETIFKMMNGTIWQQASYDYTYHYSYMPDVIIFTRNGRYYMKVEDVEDVIAVNQIH